MGRPKRARGVGWLRNGNPPGRFSDAPRCGAKARRTGLPCRAPACRGKARCRLHGGKSTGPKTAAGLERSRRARWRHGFYSRDYEEAVKRRRAELAGARGVMTVARPPLLLKLYRSLEDRNRGIRREDLEDPPAKT